jgi:putative FmdB family regulatory protein
LPLYEYKCKKCAHHFDKIEKYTASAVKTCPKCGGKAERQLAAPAIQFKGSGWYVTDYGGKTGSADSKENSGDGSSGKSADKSGESKATSEKGSEKSSEKNTDKGSEKRSDKSSGRGSEKGTTSKKK